MRLIRRNKKSEKPRVYAFIDSQNLNLGVQKVGWKMNWRGFRQYLKDEYNVTQAYMFIGYMQENESLYEQMYEAGYMVVLKPTSDITRTPQDNNDADKQDDKRIVKGNIDVDLTLYVMKELPNYDRAIIVSGDGDFYGLIEYLIKKQKLQNIMTPNWQYSGLLKQFDKYIVRIDKLRSQLAYRDRKK